MRQLFGLHGFRADLADGHAARSNNRLGNRTLAGNLDRKRLEYAQQRRSLCLGDGIDLLTRVDAALFDHHRDYLLRQQLTERVDKIAVLVLVKVREQTFVQRFFVQRGLEINLHTVLFAAEMTHMRTRGQHQRTGQTEVREQHFTKVRVELLLVFIHGQLHVAQAETH